MGGIQQQNTKTVGQTIPIPLILKMVPRQEYVEHDFQNNILGIEYAITSNNYNMCTFSGTLENRLINIYKLLVLILLRQGPECN